MGEGFIDIILFAMIAAFLVLRLRNVLGRRDGFKGQPRNFFPFTRRREEEEDGEAAEDPGIHPEEDNVVPLADRQAEDADWQEVPESQEPRSRLAQGLSAINRADPQFTGEDFLSGARMAFEMIVNAFAEGSVSTLKAMLNNEVFGNFAQAIRNREEAGETLDFTLVGVSDAEIVEAYMEGRQALVTVKFVSEQVSVTRDHDGDVVDGDPDVVAKVTDFWTFARNTRSNDPNWTLVATGSLD